MTRISFSQRPCIVSYSDEDHMKSIEISARTVAEAIQLALAQLGKDRDEVAIEVR